jgi:rhodanese-related sulfurtransferase
MKSFQIAIFLLLSFMNFHEIMAQSTSYKFLLKALYSPDFPLISITEATKSEYVFLDVREWDEYKTSHLKNAIHVGYDNFEIGSLTGIAKDAPIIVYCSIGVRSQEIGFKLKEAGYSNVFNLYGGIFHWVNEDMPVFNKNGATNKVHAYSKVWGIWLNKGEKVYE